MLCVSVFGLRRVLGSVVCVFSCGLCCLWSCVASSSVLWSFLSVSLETMRRDGTIPTSTPRQLLLHQRYGQLWGSGAKRAFCSVCAADSGRPQRATARRSRCIYAWKKNAHHHLQDPVQHIHIVKERHRHIHKTFTYTYTHTSSNSCTYTCTYT